jgi:2,3-bisphosphoglycerate-dependent phosphoglycerate mutase
MDSIFLPTYKSWRLNERMYRSIQGLSKTDVALQFDENVVQAWRRSFKARPPPLNPRIGPTYFPGNDRRYAGIDPDILPLSESLQDCMKRQHPLWNYKIKRELRKGNNVLVIGHSNSLRGLAKLIDNIADDDIGAIAFPPGIPIVYRFDRSMNPTLPEDDYKSLIQENTSGFFWKSLVY